MGELHSDYVLEKAKATDSKFLAKCIVYAERAHTGRGIFDVLGSDADIESVMEHACLNEEMFHAHYSRFFVIREKSTGTPVAGACGFFYPEYGLTKSRPGIEASLLALNSNWGAEDIAAAWKRWDFLDDCFPDFDYDNSWFPEAVYCDASHRGKGLAGHLLREVLEEGRRQGVTKSLITCAVGNDGARRVYESLGYVLVGEGHSDAATEAIGSSGFYLLHRTL